MSETPKPEEGNVEKEAPKKGGLSRWRSKGEPPSGTPEIEPASGTPELEAAIEVLEPEGGGAKPEGEVETEAEKKGWLSRLRYGLAKSTKKVTESITGLFTKKKLDQQTLNELEDALIQADLGVTVAARLVAKLGKERFGKEVTDEEVRAAFADDIAEILQPVATVACHRSGAQAACRAGDRRQRQRQDHDHRQARPPLQGRGPEGDAGGGRHLPRRRRRAAQGLGRSRRRAGDRQGHRRRRRGSRLRGAGDAPGPSAATCC